MLVLLETIGKLYALIMGSGFLALGLFYLLHWLMAPEEQGADASDRPGPEP